MQFQPYEVQEQNKASWAQYPRIFGFVSTQNQSFQEHSEKQI